MTTQQPAMVDGPNAVSFLLVDLGDQTNDTKLFIGGAMFALFIPSMTAAQLTRVGTARPRLQPPLVS